LAVHDELVASLKAARRYLGEHTLGCQVRFGTLCDCVVGKIDAALKTAESGEAMKLDWISVNDERKPPLEREEALISVPVLLYIPKSERSEYDNGIHMGWYLPRTKAFRPSACVGSGPYVTHWQPLPGPPEEE